MKETEGFIEKNRTFRDRSKKKRLSVDEKRELATNDLKPKHAPYHRKKDWMQLPSDFGLDPEDEELLNHYSDDGSL